MGLDPVTLGYLAVAALGTASSYDQSKRAAYHQKRSREIDSNRQRSEAIRQKRQEARKARIRRAQIEQAAANTGTQGSSGESGALSSITSQSNYNSSYLSGQQVAATAISDSNQRAMDSQFRSQLAGQIGSLSMDMAVNSFGTKSNK